MFPLNRDVIELAVNDLTPILRNDTESVICGPLVAGESVTGVIYAQNGARDALDNGDLKTLASLSRMAADNVRRTRYIEWLENENVRLKEETTVRHDLIGESAAMREVYKAAQVLGVHPKHLYRLARTLNVRP